MNGLALCAGAGGLELGLRLALGRAYRCVCYVEREAYAAGVLVARMEDAVLDQAPVWDDVTTFDGRPWRGRVDLVSGGFPCQPFSLAGQRGGSTMSAGCGPTSLASFARYDLDTCSWRTCQRSLPGVGSDLFSETWPRWGSMRNGSVTALRPKALRTSASVCGFLLPTPVASTAGTGNKSGNARAVWRPSLVKMARDSLWPTPTAGDATRGFDRTKARRAARGWNSGDSLIDAVRHNWATPTAGMWKHTESASVAAKHIGQGKSSLPREMAVATGQPGGRLNPTWVEWLMGWPLGLTDCDSRVTESFQQWLHVHSASFGDDYTQDGDAA